MEKKTNLLEWLLFGIRLFVGTVFILHGGPKILDLLGFSWFHEPSSWYQGGILCLAPIIEVIGGGLILTGVLIELGTILLIPGMVLFFIISTLNADFFLDQNNLRFVLNLMMLATVIGLCGPGKWALWDPGKSFRKKFLKVEN